MEDDEPKIEIVDEFDYEGEEGDDEDEGEEEFIDVMCPHCKKPLRVYVEAPEDDEEEDEEEEEFY